MLLDHVAEHPLPSVEAQEEPFSSHERNGSQLFDGLSVFRVPHMNVKIIACADSLSRVSERF